MKKIIGIAGPARSGKDTLADSIISVLGFTGTEAKKASFANALKQECRQFVLDTIGIDTFSENDEDKKIIRPFLVTWGTHVRRKLNPNVWVESVEKELSEDFVTIVADLRYPNELEWIRNLGGYIIYVDRLLPDGSKVIPANEEEAMNCPLLLRGSDFHLTWNSLDDKDTLSAIASSVLDDTIPSEVRKSWT